MLAAVRERERESEREFLERERGKTENKKSNNSITPNYMSCLQCDIQDVPSACHLRMCETRAQSLCVGITCARLAFT